MVNEITWPDQVWKEINDAALVEMGKVRTAQKVFPTAHFENDPTQVPDEAINFQNLSIVEGQTKPFVEISATFTLTSNQVKLEPDLRTCKTLARMAAKALALAEDMYFFQSSAAGPRAVGNPQLPANTWIENWRYALDLGILRAAVPEDANNDANRVAAPLDVDRVAGENPNGAEWGNATFARVAKGITLLVGKAQAAPYALILPTRAYADTFIPPSAASLVTVADRIKPLVEGGFYSCPVLPEFEGLLVALAGDPVNLFVGREVMTEFVVRQQRNQGNQGNQGNNIVGNNFVFRVMERVQYVVRDPRSLVLLRFAQPQG